MKGKKMKVETTLTCNPYHYQDVTAILINATQRFPGRFKKKRIIIQNKIVP